MVVKVEAALRAIEHGVGQVIFSDARVEHPVQRALAGEGTRIGVPAVRADRWRRWLIYHLRLSIQR